MEEISLYWKDAENRKIKSLKNRGGCEVHISLLSLSGTSKINIVCKFSRQPFAASKLLKSPHAAHAYLKHLVIPYLTRAGHRERRANRWAARELTGAKDQRQTKLKVYYYSDGRQGRREVAAQWREAEIETQSKQRWWTFTETLCVCRHTAPYIHTKLDNQVLVQITSTKDARNDIKY